MICWFGRRASVDDIWRLFQPFVLQRIEQQMVVLLDNGFDGLAAGGCPAAEQRLDAILGDELLSLLRAIRGIRTAVRYDHFDLLTIQSARRICFLNGKPHCIYQRGLTDRHRAGKRMQHADFYAGPSALLQH